MLNEYYQKPGIREYFKRYGAVNGMRRGLFQLNPLHSVKDYELKKLLWQKRASGYVGKYMKYADTVPCDLIYRDISVPENPVWVFWNTGVDNAPEIIRACVRSVERHCGGSLVLLNDENVKDYLTMPPYIMSLRESGSLSMAAYSDLLRFSLLEHFGGTWIDASVFLSGPVPAEILESDFFAMRNSMCLVDNPALYAVWFLHAESGNETVRKIRNVSFAYWKHERHVIEYLLSNLIITGIVSGTGAEAAMPYMLTDYSEQLVRILGERYSAEKLDWLFRQTPVHKLTYKLDPSLSELENSVYRKLIEQ